MKTFKKYYSLISQSKVSLFAAIFLVLVTGVSSIVVPKIIGDTADMISLGTLTVSSLKNSLILLTIIALICYAGNVYWNYNIFKNYYIVDGKLRMQILKKALKESPVFIKKNSVSEILTKATSDTYKVGDLLGYGVLALVDGVIQPIILFIFMANISVKLTIIPMIGLPIMVYLITKISKSYEPAYSKLQKSVDNLNESAIESFNAIKVIKAFCVEKIKKDSYIKDVDENLKKELKTTRLSALYTPVVDLSLSFFTIISLFIGAHFITNGTISYGELITFSLYLNYLGWPAFALSDLIVLQKEGRTSLNRIDELLEYDDDFPDDSKLQKLDEINCIELKNYSFSYPGNQNFELKNIDLKIEKGKKLAVVGKTGSGKSTLLKQLIQEYANYSGNYLINGNDIRKFNKKSIRIKQGYVPQEHFLLSKTIKENISFFRQTNDEELQKAVEISDFNKDLKQLPLGLHTLTGEMGVSLSGGQKQRVSLSRAVLKNSDMLILDDVLSAVDNITEKNILDNLNKYFKDRIVVMSSHKISAIKDFDEIIVMSDGEIVERGTYDDLILNGKWFNELSKIQEVKND